ncbi:MAG TPA: T9SS type A sorting domain-containing protein [Rubricoccaceae bacterium]
MIRRLTLTVLAALVPALAEAQTVPQWQELASSPYNSYRSEDVFFIGRRGWAVNGTGGAWRTDDGGDTWAQTANLFRYLRATTFATPEIGWIGVLFSPVQLYETRNGGATYTDITSRIQPALPSGMGICGMWTVDAQTVYAVGQYSTPAYIVRTTDGGQTWTSRAMAPLVDALIDIRFFDAQHGLAIGSVGPQSDSRARIIGTDDGGATWTVRHTVSNLNAIGWKMTFPTRLVGYASVERFTNDPDGQTDAVVLKTVDGGQTWAEIRVPDGGSLQGIGFATPDLGWISGRGLTSVTTDGGASWARLPPTRTGPNAPITPGGQLDGSVNRFRFYGDSLAYAAGFKIYRLRGRFPTVVTDTPVADAPDGLVAVYPNPSVGPVTVAYRTSAAGPVTLDIVDVRGRTVAVLVDETVAPGEHTAAWTPARTAPGVYVVRLRTALGVTTRRIAVAGR